MMSHIRQTIVELLSRRGGLSAQAIARSIGLSKTATRYHLRLLVQDKLIVARAPECHGDVGRPEAVYRLAEEAYDSLPCLANELAIQLLDSVEETWGEGAMRALLRRAGKRQAGHEPLIKGNASVELRISRAVRFLNRQGYSCRATRQSGTVTLMIASCPYRKVVQFHPLVCELDSELVKTLLDLPSRPAIGMASAEGPCRFVINTN